ncbi:MAG: hypothetical protein ACE5HV_01955 [Acidobacteriota bacterium]
MKPGKLRFAQYLLPGIVFQSVLIGGAYATGREIVQYGARFGPLGAWSILAIFAGFSVMAMLAFEFARISRVYDYRSFIRSLIGPLWPLFDFLFVVMAIIIIAVVGAASGSVVEEILGLPFWVGVGLVIVLVGALNASGRRAIEQFKTYGSVLLYAGYILFAGLILAKKWGNVVGAFEMGSRAFGVSATSDGASALGGGLTVGAAVTTGILYVGYNLATLPATSFTLDRQTRRRQALLAGMLAGLMSTIPFVLTFLAIMAFYPDEKVLGAAVPWLAMLRRETGEPVIWIYALVILWTLIETSTGMIHAIVDRIAVNLKELDRRPLERGQVAALTVSVLLVAALLSRIGLIDLVARGYTMMAYGFLLLFALPLATVGLVRILRYREVWSEVGSCC